MLTLTRDLVDSSMSFLSSTRRSYPSHFSITELAYLSIKIALGAKNYLTGVINRVYQ